MSQRAYYEAWNLAQWYLELTLLKLCGYEGSHGNRLNQKWVGEVEPLGQWLVTNCSLRDDQEPAGPKTSD